LAENRVSLITIDTENILVASGGDYVKFALDFCLNKENLYSMLDTYYSFRAALTSATTLDTWLTNRGISIAKVKSWIETNGLTTATSGFAK